MDVQLKVVQGKPHGHFIRFPQGEYVFGRGPECYIRPNSEWVSRQHCMLRVDKQGVWLRDLGSTNGTLVNGKLIKADIPLHHGDRLQLGPLVLELIVAAEGTLSDGAEGNTLNDTTEAPAGLTVVGPLPVGNKEAVITQGPPQSKS